MKTRQPFTITREEKIRILMWRRGWRCTDMVRLLANRGITVEHNAFYLTLRRKVKPGGRGRTARVKRILTTCLMLLEGEDNEQDSR